MKAIDLYCGIGGWSLGLRLSGVNVISAYDRWKPAIDTYTHNLGRHAIAADLRQLALSEFPKNVDIVVGSPPCTEFSYSNRGGNGNIAEGLKDITRMLMVVDLLKPRYWVMENVPRVKRILERALFEKSGALRKYRHLFEDDESHITVVDMSQYGLPQRRRRCIAGRFPLALLQSYSETCEERTLGEVIDGLSKNRVFDPIYGVELDKREITGLNSERHLDSEEIRLNCDAKQHHPIYNRMAFPDEIERPSRTVTATCTRVSRESIIVRDKTNRDAMRRLRIRERACLQGFPITYQFKARSSSEAEKMIGNALPPLFSYYVGCAIRGVKPTSLKHPAELNQDIGNQTELVAIPENRAKQFIKYRANRRFRATIPSLRFRSGVRFELKNCAEGETTRWWIEFVYGTPSDIRVLELNSAALRRLYPGRAYKSVRKTFYKEIERLEKIINNKNTRELQSVWTHRNGDNGTKDGFGPYDYVDEIGRAAKRLKRDCKGIEEIAQEEVSRLLRARGCPRWQQSKIKENGTDIYIGILLGARVNALLAAQSK